MRPSGGLPDAERAIIDERKITAYLLDPGHRDGGSKANFYLAHGYSREHWTQLARDLLEHGRSHPVVEIEMTEHGTKYIIVGEIMAPDGLCFDIRSTWIILDGEQAPRFVTGYYFGGGTR